MVKSHCKITREWKKAVLPIRLLKKQVETSRRKSRIVDERSPACLAVYWAEADQSITCLRIDLINMYLKNQHSNHAVLWMDTLLCTISRRKIDRKTIPDVKYLLRSNEFYFNKPTLSIGLICDLGIQESSLVHTIVSWNSPTPARNPNIYDLIFYWSFYSI